MVEVHFKDKELDLKKREYRLSMLHFLWIDIDQAVS